MQVVLDCVSDLMKALLRELARRAPDQRRSFAASRMPSGGPAAGWQRLGGYAAYATTQVGGKRPHRVGKDDDGEYWIWVDQSAAQAIQAGLGFSGKGDAQ